MSNAFDTDTAPTTEPNEIVAGDFTAWRRPDLVQNYPPALYALSYECRAEVSGHKKTISATESTTDYSLAILSAASLLFSVGVWHWSAYITRESDSERKQVDSGIFLVLADKATANTDPRTLPQKMLAEIDRAMLHRAQNSQIDVTSYSLGAETSASRDTSQLITWRSYWRRELIKANQKHAMRAGRIHSGIRRTSF
jgi:hypothetical protein